MKKILNHFFNKGGILFLFLFLFLNSCLNTSKVFHVHKQETLVEMKTSKGNMVIKLYDNTPIHKENFIKLIKTDFYQGITFHRVIKDFMAQAGDPKSRDLDLSIKNPQDNEGETLPAEIKSEYFHKKGALAAARMGDNVNPEKRSSGSQFYLVQGKKYTANQLKQMGGRIKHSFSQQAIDAYQSIGGTPFLDYGYTVFGEVIEGIEIIDAICAVKTAAGDKPVEPVTILSVKIKR